MGQSHRNGRVEEHYIREKQRKELWQVAIVMMVVDEYCHVLYLGFSMFQTFDEDLGCVSLNMSGRSLWKPVIEIEATLGATSCCPWD